MKELTSFQAKTELAELIREVEGGRTSTDHPARQARAGNLSRQGTPPHR